MILARRALRGIGLRAQVRLRRADRRVGVHFGDGGTLSIGPEDMLIDRLGTSPVAHLNMFARAFSRIRGWKDNTEGQAWPFPQPERPGMPLAGSAPALARHTAERLRNARVVFLHDLEDRKQRALTTLRERFNLAAAPAAQSDDTILLLTPECRTELTGDPAWYRDRLQSLSDRYPDARVLIVDGACDQTDGQPLAQLLSVMDAEASSSLPADDIPNPD